MQEVNKVMNLRVTGRSHLDSEVRKSLFEEVMLQLRPQRWEGIRLVKRWRKSQCKGNRKAKVLEARKGLMGLELS